MIKFINKLNKFSNIFLNLLQQKRFIKVNDINTIEIVNVNYALNKSDIVYLYNQIIDSHSQADTNERNNILKFFLEFNFTENTRQAVMQPKYDSNTNLASCISCLSCIIRYGVLNIHVFVRSQNFSNNFIYDNQTYCLLMSYLSHKLKVKVGKVYVKIISLHKIID